MDLFEEYKKQQGWRNWHQYLRHIPLCDTDHVVDLGCSVGSVSALLSERVKFVTGIDVHKGFIAPCQTIKRSNQALICEDIEKVDYRSIGPINGVWSSFSLSYLKRPEIFLRNLNGALESGGWMALVDVSCFVSGNMPINGRFHDEVQEYESESWRAGLYDFDFGSKLESALEKTGFKVVYINHDVPDQELNFSGPATPEVLNNWTSRLERMKGLRTRFAGNYHEVCEELLSYIVSPSRSMRNNVKFAVGVKI